MKRLLIPFFILSISVICSFAQTTADALRFSQFGIGGTARTIAIGGSIGALGADFSVISTNPAGLGTYRASEFTMTPSLFISNVDASLRGGSEGTTTEKKTNFNFNNIGIVFGKTINRESSNWLTSNFSIGINRLSNFNENVSYSGATQGSYLDAFQESATGLLPEELNDFDNGLAWDVGAIYDIEDDGFYETDVELTPDARIQKMQSIEKSGSINEVVLGIGGFRKDKLLVGMTLGFPIASYTERSTYVEADDATDEVPAFNGLTYTQDLTTTGFGLNLKVGAIYRISQMIRVGAAVHTPTRLRLTDDYQTTILYDYEDPVNGGVFEASSPESTFDYDIKTPWRFIASGALLIKRSGFISAEVEYVNYGGASFHEPRTLDGSAVNTGFFNELNRDVENAFQSVLLIRAGGEYALKKLRVRGGINIAGSPYAGESDSKTTYSAGVGFREKKFFVDATYQFSSVDDTFSPYSTANAIQQEVGQTATQNGMFLTLGFRF